MKPVGTLRHLATAPDVKVVPVPTVLGKKVFNSQKLKQGLTTGNFVEPCWLFKYFEKPTIFKRVLFEAGVYKFIFVSIFYTFLVEPDPEPPTKFGSGST